jgi:NAD(P)-dependent dehydrogenase (short-subunit alcohol dehydrogenase family)
MLESAEKELAAFGHGVVARRCDVRVEDDAKALMDAAAGEFGSLDYLVNNAGIAPSQRWKAAWPYVRDMDEELWMSIFDTNDKGIFLCSKHAIPYMERQKSGHIVNVNSGSGGRVGPQSMAYIMSKAVLMQFTRFLAEQEREHNICVMAINPGGGFATEDAPEKVRSEMPGPEIAGDRFFLAIDADMSLSGRIVTLDGDKLVPVDLELNHETLVRDSPMALARLNFP